MLKLTVLLSAVFAGGAVFGSLTHKAEASTPAPRPAPLCAPDRETEQLLLKVSASVQELEAVLIGHAEVIEKLERECSALRTVCGERRAAR